MKKELEKDIQLAVCEYLERKGHFFWRQNNIPVFQDGHYRAMPKYSLNGVPDIMVIKDGFFIGLEIKTKNGKQSESQKVFERRLKFAGGEYYIIRGVDQLKEIGL